VPITVASQRKHQLSSTNPPAGGQTIINEQDSNDQNILF